MCPKAIHKNVIGTILWISKVLIYQGAQSVKGFAHVGWRIVQKNWTIPRKAQHNFPTTTISRIRVSSLKSGASSTSIPFLNLNLMSFSLL